MRDRIGSHQDIFSGSPRPKFTKLEGKESLSSLQAAGSAEATSKKAQKVVQDKESISNKKIQEQTIQ